MADDGNIDEPESPKSSSPTPSTTESCFTDFQNTNVDNPLHTFWTPTNENIGVSDSKSVYF